MRSLGSSCPITEEETHGGFMVVVEPYDLMDGKNEFQIEVGTPWKINMEHNHGGLEDHFPF